MRDARTSGTTRHVVASSLTNELAFRIQEDILRGELRPGMRLFQEELSERYGVSRTPLREAIHRLEAQGLVRKLSNRGVVVRRLSERELEEVYVMRAELEAFAAALAAEHADDALLMELDAAQAALTGAVEDATRDPSGGYAAALNDRISAGNSAFHAAIHAAAGNQRLGETIASLENAFPKDYVWRALSGEDERRTLNVDEHRRIRDALARHDVTAAREEMRAHILHAWRLLHGYLAELGFWQDDAPVRPA
jgi:DNA-binding GntR family transcriptional regulator